MKYIIVSIAIIIIIACSTDNHSENIRQNEKYKVNYQIDTIQINSKNFIKITSLSNENINCLTTLQGDTIIPFDSIYFRLSISDVNLDGYEDLRIYFFSSTPNLCSTYFYDVKKKAFHLIKNSDLDFMPIKGTEYFYSYVSIDCSDYNWRSDLSKIENYQLVRLGRIRGKGCGVDKGVVLEKPIINIYKVDFTEEEMLYKSLPYEQNIQTFGDKWGFIEKYWYANYQEFES